MIVPMKHLSLVLLESERNTVLEGLRSLGAVHLDLKLGTTPGQEAVLTRYRQAQEAMNFLGKPKTVVPAAEVPTDALEQVLKLQNETKLVDEKLLHWTKRMEFWAPWGDFDVVALRTLAEKGLFLNLYQVPGSQEARFAGVEGRIVLRRDKTHVYFAVLSRIPDLLEGATHIPWPEVHLDQKKARIAEMQGLSKGLKAEAERMSAWFGALKAQAAELERLIDWESAKGGVGSFEGLAYLTGYVPVDHSEALLKFAAQHGVAVALSDLTEEHQPPTKLKNSFFPNLMSPVFELLGVTPGYAERDISWPFFFFFSIFFGMILGDAAYGLILTSLGGFLLIRNLMAGGKGKEAWILFTWLGLCTTAWGTVTGTWFATDFSQLPPVLKALVLPLFNPEIVQGGAAAVSNNVTVFCFTLGVLQLGLASLWNFVQMVTVNPLKSLSHFGWLSLTVALYLLVLSMVANINLLADFFPEPLLSLLFVKTATGLALPGWVVPVIGISYGLILLFSFQEGKFWKGLLEGVSNFLPTSLNAISAFADNISYIRLFAVGLAGFYIEVSFAAMAKGFGMDSIGGIAATVAVLVFGHTLNLIMGFLSVIVHGIRLNVLEFSNRLGMEWSGRPYDPFRVKS